MLETWRNKVLKLIKVDHCIFCFLRKRQMFKDDVLIFNVNTFFLSANLEVVLDIFIDYVF